MKRADLEAHIQHGVQLVKTFMPMMVPLIVQARISMDMRVETACVFPSGRILLSPHFIASMSPLELAYLIAHEILHLYYKTHEREGTFDHNLVNIAHDFIINARLSKVFGIAPPGGGLDWSLFKNALYDNNLE